MKQATEQHFRPIRSYVRRLGRMTKAQKSAMTDFGNQYLVNQNMLVTLGWQNLFPTVKPLHLEIGIGMGEHLLFQAKLNPDINYIGADVHEPGIGHCCRILNEQGLTNARMICGDIKDYLQIKSASAVFDKIYILFPDPWHKKKHNKRRLIQTGFIDLLAQKLKPNGLIHVMTDWMDYAEHIQFTFNQSPLFKDVSDHHPLMENRIITKFEKKGRQAGRAISSLVYEKVTAAT